MATVTVGTTGPSGRDTTLIHGASRTASTLDVRIAAVRTPADAAAYAARRYPQTVRQLRALNVCYRCGELYRPMEALGRWQCRRHLRDDLLCCTQSAGCVPCDHAVARQCNSRHELRCLQLPEHLVTLLGQEGGTPLCDYAVGRTPEQLGAPGGIDYDAARADRSTPLPADLPPLLEPERLCTVFIANAPLN
jgi:hypothetical protein